MWSKVQICTFNMERVYVYGNRCAAPSYIFFLCSDLILLSTFFTISNAGHNIILYDDDIIFFFIFILLYAGLPAALPFTSFVDSWIFIYRESAKCVFHMDATSKLIKFVSDIQSPFWNQEQWELNNYNFNSHFAYTKIYLAFIRKRSIRLNWIFAWINPSILWILLNIHFVYGVTKCCFHIKFISNKLLSKATRRRNLAKQKNNTKKNRTTKWKYRV